MKFTASILTAILAPLVVSHAYTVGGYSSCSPPRGNSAFRARMREFTPLQREDYRRQQSEFVDRAFEALADDLQKSQMNPDFIPKQREFVDNAVKFFADMGGINRMDAESLRDISNRGFEIAQDIASGSYSPAYETQDKETELEILLDVPGVAREDIDIAMDDGFLMVSGTRKKTKAETSKAVPFSRSFAVDKAYDKDNISASLENGVLTIRVPKKEVEKPPAKRIEIN